MSISIAELLLSIPALSHVDKLRLVQLVLAQLVQDEGLEVEERQQPIAPFELHQFFGV